MIDDIIKRLSSPSMVEKGKNYNQDIKFLLKEIEDLRRQVEGQVKPNKVELEELSKLRIFNQKIIAAVSEIQNVWHTPLC